MAMVKFTVKQCLSELGLYGKYYTGTFFCTPSKPSNYLIPEPKRVALLATFLWIFLTVKIIFCIKTSKQHDIIKLTASHAKIHEYILVKETFGVTNFGQGKESELV